MSRGAAFDIAGRGVVHPQSMVKVVKLAARMAQRREFGRGVNKTAFSYRSPP